MEDRVDGKWRATLRALAAAFLFGIATPFSKTLLSQLRANQLAGLLYLGAGFCMLPWVMRRWGSGWARISARCRSSLR